MAHDSRSNPTRPVTGISPPQNTSDTITAETAAVTASVMWSPRIESPITTARRVGALLPTTTMAISTAICTAVVRQNTTTLATRYAQVDKPTEARDWVAEVLGELAAEQLHLHANTVKYRVGRALACRGHAIGADRLDVELALLLCHWYGKAVAQPRPA